jgi:TolA-binding protein
MCQSFHTLFVKIVLVKILCSMILASSLTSCLHRSSTDGSEGIIEATPKEAGTDSSESPKPDVAKGESGSFLGFFQTNVPKKNIAKEESDLRLAKLWARVDQLSDDQGRLKEKIKVLEKGLTLGLIPEELKKDFENSKVDLKHIPLKDDKNQEHKQVKKNKEPEVIEENPVQDKSQDKKEESDVTAANDEKKYREDMAVAHDHFRAGRYSRAIVEYDGIGKKYGDQLGDGSQKFWAARCWVNMKDYATAHQLLAEFLKDHPGSSWAPRAKLELARVEWKLGLGETALSRFRDVIRDYPQEDAAEMAKMELSNLDKTL